MSSKKNPNKTIESDRSVEEFINAIDNESRRQDSWEMLALMEKLGPHKTGKSCLYLKNLQVVDADVLEELIIDSVTHMRAKYPSD